MILLALLGCRNEPAWTPRAAAHAPWAEEGGEPIPIPDDLAALEWLGEPSAWGWEGVPGDRTAAGAWGLGNGEVFALAGLDDPVSTLTNAVGPGYQADAGFFGDAGLALWEGDAALPVTRAQAQRPRGTSVVRTLAESDGVLLLTTDVAPPGEPWILRHVAVRDIGGAARTLTLRWSLARADGEVAPEGDGLLQVRGTRWMRLGCPGAEVDGDTLVVPVALPAGGEWSAACAVSFAAGGAPEDVEPDAVAALTAAADDVGAWLAGGVTLELPDPKVADLVEGLLVTTHVQTSPLGVPSPMSRYTGGWLRDVEGPVRLWLRTGHPDDALAALRGLWLGELAGGGVANSFSLDVDPDAVALPDDPEAWWAAASFMSGREPAEAPSFAVLLHAEAAAWTGEAWDAQRVAFLGACLDRQEVTDGRLRFSGDETFRWPMAFAVGDEPEALGWSANSTFLWRAAAIALGRDPAGAPDDPFWTGTFWSPILGFDDDALLDAPYEDVALVPTWWDAGLDEDRVAANYDATVAALLRDDGTLLSRLHESDLDNVGYTGMVPGMFLHAAASRHAPEEALAFAALDLVATPSGHFEELHGADDLPLAVQHAADGLGGDVSARYRPWEGGDTVAALLDYLLGVTPTADGVALAPHVPPGWPGFAVRGLRVRDVVFDVEVTAYEEGVGVVVTGGEGGTLVVTLHGDAALHEVQVDGEPVDVPGGDVVTVSTPWSERVAVRGR